MSDEGEGEGEGDDAQPAVEPIVATITLTERDLRAGIIESSLVYRIRWGFVVVVLFMNGVVRLGGGVSYDDGGMSVGLQVLFALFLFAAPWWNARKHLRRLIQAGDASATYRFDNAGVTIRSAGASGSISYRRIVKSRQGKSSLLLYTSDQVGEAIPLRAFSADELARIRAFLPRQAEPKTLRSGTRMVILWFSVVLAALVAWQFLSKQSPPPPTPGSDPAGPR